VAFFTFVFLAERGGFEPPIGYEPIHAFQACDLNHSSISPACFSALTEPHIIARILCSTSEFLHPPFSTTKVPTREPVSETSQT
jgi:hypothetical protein